MYLIQLIKLKTYLMNLKKFKNEKNFIKKIKMGNQNLLSKLPSPQNGKSGWPWTEETSPEIYKDLKYIPKISIITPSLNQGSFIEQTIRSVLLQNYPSLEYIIIDGGSNDNSVEIIRKYEPWIKYWVSEKDSGQSEAINKGILMCDGEIFNWINSDDYYNKETFKHIAENFADKKYHVVTGKYRFFDDENNKEDKLVDFKLGASVEETIALILVNQPSTFFRFDIFKGLGNLNEKLHLVMDQDIWKKYLIKYGQDNIKIVDIDLVNFRFHTNSKTSLYEFKNEYNSIFYSIAAKAGMTRHMKLLKKIYGNEISSEYEFDMVLTDADVIKVKKVINTLIYYNARIAFKSENYELMDECLLELETKWLSPNLAKNAFKLKLKSKMIKYKLSHFLKYFRDVPNVNLKK